jgi:hypothetical protein
MGGCSVWDVSSHYRYEKVITMLSPLQVTCSYRIFHLTDIHIDSTYIQNSDPAQFCHRKSAIDTDNTAGKYGALGTACDSPVPLV